MYPGCRSREPGGDSRRDNQDSETARDCSGISWDTGDSGSVGLPSGESNREFLSAQQPTGTNCSALSLPHLIKNKQTKKAKSWICNSVERTNEP